MAKRTKKSGYPLVRGIARGVYSVLGLVADMDIRGVPQEIRRGKVQRKTKDGKDMTIQYGYGVKVGLDGAGKKLKASGESHGIDRTIA